MADDFERSFTARPHADGKRCEIVIETENGRAIVRLSREETFKLGQTLLLMTQTLKSGGDS